MYIHTYGMLACVCMYLSKLYMYGCVWKCDAYVWRLLLKLLLFSFLFSTLFWGEGSESPSLNLELSLTWTNLAIQLVLGIPILSLPSARIAGTCHTCLAFVWVLGIQIVVLMFPWQALYSLSMYPNSLVLPDYGRH